jgi:superfamily II DNA or RNA helicase
MNVELRNYQTKGIADIFNAWDNAKNILFQMPTGTDKTTLSCEIARIFSIERFPSKCLYNSMRFSHVKKIKL